ncbi:MAG: acyl-CoA reductase [Akkermansiaceae bacterium]|nr:acyl-CoA reductase [Akkermansiaceae bacterium]
MTLSERIDLILASSEQLEPFTGNLTRKLLEETFLREASSAKVQLPKTIVHIVSGNTPHAALQTLLNGVLLGAQNLLKLPSQALLDLEVPNPLQPFVEVSRELPDHWIPQADAMVVFGSDNTIRHFQNLCPLEIPFVGHGHRVGIAIIDEPTPKAAQLAARDIGLFNQSGCLSLQTIYLKDPCAFGTLLAEAMTNFEKQDPRGPLSLSEAGAITNLREETRYLMAQDPKSHALWHSPGSTAWTIIFENDSRLALSPGNRTIFLRPMPDDFSNLTHLSGIALHPYEERPNLPSPRIFPLGEAQSPPALWPHDGILPLASLVRHHA